jgi:Zn-dependent peptidase ImmA (M78 family)
MNNKEDVWGIVEEFRSQHSKELGGVPGDVLTVIELNLRLNVIPFPDLFKRYSVDAAIVPDFSGIYVDKASYRFLEGKPLRHFNRLRFSLAHELGHIVMHRQLAPFGGFKTTEDFWTWMRAYEKNRYSLEQKANEFAGRLLVPLERLSREFDDISVRMKAGFPEFWSHAGLRNALCEQLGDKFGVSAEVISMRLTREEIWPAT